MARLKYKYDPTLNELISVTCTYLIGRRKKYLKRNAAPHSSVNFNLKCVEFNKINMKNTHLGLYTHKC